MTWALVAVAAFVLLAVAASGLFLSELWRVSVRGGVPSIASTWAIVDRVIAERVLPTEGLVLDLGSGTGWTLRRFWRSGLRGPFEGYERAFVPWFIGTCWNALSLAPIRLLRRDMLAAPLERAAAVYVFLLPESLKRLAPELARRMTRGTTVVSAEFAVPGWRPVRTLEARGVTRKHAAVYVYEIGRGTGD